MGMGINQWEWEEMGILIVFPHTFSVNMYYMYSLKTTSIYDEKRQRTIDLFVIVHRRIVVRNISSASILIIL